MKYTYELIEDTVMNSQSIKRIDEDGNESWLPVEPANSDYQTYLKSIKAAQSTPSVE